MKIYLGATDSGVAVHPWPPELEPYLTLERRQATSVPVLMKSGRVKNVSRTVHSRKKLWYLDKNVGFAPPAMFLYILDVLKKTGADVEVSDMRTPCPEPDWSLLGRTPRESQPEMLKLMSTERHALIQAPTGLGKTEVIVQWRRINPSLRLAVVTFTGPVRDSIADRLKAGAPDQSVCVIGAGLPKFTADTYVLLDKSLHKIDPEELDVMIIDEVHGAGSEAAFDQFLRFTDLRMYGLSATPFGRHDKADLAPIALCGPVRINLPYSFAVDIGANVPLTAYIYRADGPENISGMSRHMREKLGIWRNRRRNALISCIADGLPEDEQTLTLCRSIEHVLRLHKFMPGHTCVFRKPTPDREETLVNWGLLPPGWASRPEYMTDVDGARVLMEENRLKKTIATLVWKQGLDFKHLRWLIRADGTRNSIFGRQAGGRLARKPEGKTEAGIIDFWDDFGGMLDTSRFRVSTYRKVGWDVRFMFDA